MDDFNLMLAKYGVYTINQENGKFVFFASNPNNIYTALSNWKAGAKKGIYPPVTQGSFLIVRKTEPVSLLSVYVLCRDVPGYVSNTDIIEWKEVTI